MRADRSEIFNVWNKVTPQEWLEICSRDDLHPMVETVEEPRQDDAGLYRQRQPYPHACIAGVVGKTPPADLPAGKKIVLALLAWNTRDIALDSVRAHIREARMLRRLGQEPCLCICDDDSNDGLADALQAFEPHIDVPHKFIFNRTNLGSSIARNQIIDYMLTCDADYLLLMDGDIEIVPFSSFAMLRYMENNGHQLGCIGADSLGQTPHRERASPYLFSVDGCRLETTNLVAWTQYGMFRREVFDDGVRFDETRPFDGAGWGFEDNDLAIQMDMKGYLNQRFFGMTYLHRDVRSSIRIMHARGIDVAGIYARRKQYVIDKWAVVPHINNGPLALLRRVTI
jgi:glycosyltransferase involved in cell wall biosynthesis